MRWNVGGVLGAVAFVILLTAGALSTSAAAPVPAQSTSAQGSVDRGEYIAKHVAMCVQCHSPRDERGELIQTQLFHGAPMPVTSPFPGKPFAYHAPRLAGLPAGFSAQQLAHFLETGERPAGFTPRPPMPPFRMSAADAASVAAYLESLR
jgi:cytochrome c553